MGIIHRTNKFLIVTGFALFIVAGCSSAEVPTALPTLTLIQATATLTPTPVTPTATRMSLPGPSDLVTPTPEDGFVSTPSTSRQQASLLESDPIAADLVSLAQRRLANELDLATLRIRLVEVETYQWTDSSLGCPVSGQVYAEVLIIGYRIVLSAGEDDYIFHSDSEQLIPCDADNEVLPE